MTKQSEYKEGYIDGITAYAYQKDGVSYVGTTGRTLRDAVDDVENTWNYHEPKIAPYKAPNLESRLVVLIREGRAMQENFKDDLNGFEDTEIDLEAGLTSLEDALRNLQEVQEEHANSSAANYKDYMAEERATTDRDNN